LQLINQLQVLDAVAPTKNRTTNTTRRPAGQLLSVKAVAPGKKTNESAFFYPADPGGMQCNASASSWWKETTGPD
jgi:hypothetical protein